MTRIHHYGAIQMSPCVMGFAELQAECCGTLERAGCSGHSRLDHRLFAILGPSHGAMETLWKTWEVALGADVLCCGSMVFLCPSP